MSTDPAHSAVAAGIMTIAREIGCQVVAEGIETIADLAAVRQAGVGWGQGSSSATPPRTSLPPARRLPGRY
jgi:EAL domain-containing protein (putative c-di-GMP-specific phosphodiesterase class I)